MTTCTCLRALYGRIGHRATCPALARRGALSAPEGFVTLDSGRQGYWVACAALSVTAGALVALLLTLG